MLGSTIIIAVVGIAALSDIFNFGNVLGVNDNEEGRGSGPNEEPGDVVTLQSDGGAVQSIELAAGTTELVGTDGSDTIIAPSVDGLTVDAGLGADTVQVGLGTNISDSADDAQEGASVDVFLLNVTAEDLVDPVTPSAIELGGASTDANSLFISLPEGNTQSVYVSLSETTSADGTVARLGAIFLSDSADLALADLATSATQIASLDLGMSIPEGEDTRLSAPEIATTNGVAAVFTDDALAGASDALSAKIGTYEDLTGLVGDIVSLTPNDLLAPATGSLTTPSTISVLIDTPESDASTVVLSTTDPLDTRVAIATAGDDVISTQTDPAAAHGIAPLAGNDEVTFGLGTTITSIATDGDTFAEDGADFYTLNVTEAALAIRADPDAVAPAAAVVEYFDESDTLVVEVPDGFILHTVVSADVTQVADTDLTVNDATMRIYLSEATSLTVSQLLQPGLAIEVAELGLGSTDATGSTGSEDTLNTNPIVRTNAVLGTQAVILSTDGNVVAVQNANEGDPILPGILSTTVVGT